jgi:hypothetical protein
VWHAEPVQYALRYFSPGKGFGTDPYDSICSVFLCADVGFLFGLNGRMTLPIWRELQDKLREIGIQDLLVIRKGERVWYETETGKVVARRAVRLPQEARQTVSPIP